jgi:hypothetical protein
MVEARLLSKVEAQLLSNVEARLLSMVEARLLSMVEAHKKINPQNRFPSAQNPVSIVSLR